VRIDFHRKLRDEEKYADLTTLTRQIARDVEDAKAFFNGQDVKTSRTANL
jgi:riboflavin kinase/FMN adenylyltransferase